MSRSIFDECKFIGDEYSNNLNTVTNESYMDLNYGAYFSEGTYIKNCNPLISEEMIQECAGNADLIKQSAILEGAKIDWVLKNFLEEGQDYKGLKKEVNKIIEANNLPKDQIKSKGKGLIHICKRILQIIGDLNVCAAIGATASNIFIGTKFIAAGSAAAGSVLITGTIVIFIVGFIINRILRYCYDSAEFNAISTDAVEIIQTLRKHAKETNDAKLSAKLNKQADNLQKALNKYSKK